MGVLTRREINDIKKTFGNMLTPLSQTVAKVYTAQGSSEWHDTGTWGAIVVCLDRVPPACSALKLVDLEVIFIFKYHIYNIFVIHDDFTCLFYL